MSGLIFALIPMIAWGSIGFVSNRIGGTANQQTLGMTLGAFVFALGVWLVIQPRLSLGVILIGLVGGLLWSLGQNGQFHAMKFMGVSVAGPLSAGSQLVIGGLIGAMVFHEWHLTIQYMLGITAFVLLVIGFYFSAKQDPDKPATTHFVNYSKGFRTLAYSTFGYLSYTILFNNLSEPWFHVTVDRLAVILPMSLGMMLGASAFSGFKVQFEAVVLKNGLVGLMWGIGNVFMLLAAQKAGLAIAFSFSQLGVLITTVGGIYFLGEHKTARELRYIVIGSILFVIGAILLSIVKRYG